MTVFNSKGYDAKANNVFYRTGKNIRVVNSEHDIVAASTSNGDIFVLAEGLTVNSRIHRIMAPYGTPALTTAADNDIGFYYMKDGTLTAVDADILVDGGDLSSALTTRDLLSLNASLDRTKTIGELVSLNSDSTYADGLYLCLTMNTATTADGTLDVDVHIECPTAN